ncbi:MAG: hypothetical protein ACAI35_04255 [Candidatus Methylacidiphilales bacterium]|nr:hypothetical protein [Candidatus Methylacidiphilales bacterium]
MRLYIPLATALLLVLSFVAFPRCAYSDDKIVAAECEVTSNTDEGGIVTRVIRNKNGDTLTEKLVKGKVVARTLPTGAKDEITYDNAGREIKCTRTQSEKTDVFENLFDSQGNCYGFRHDGRIAWLLVKDKKGHNALTYYTPMGKLSEIEYLDIEPKRIIGAELQKFMEGEGKDLGLPNELGIDAEVHPPKLKPGEVLPPSANGTPLCPNHIQGTTFGSPSFSYTVTFGTDRVEPAKTATTALPWIFQSEEVVWTYPELAAVPTGSTLTISTGKPAFVKVKATRIQKYKDQKGVEGKSETHSTTQEVCVLKIEFEQAN